MNRKQVEIILIGLRSIVTILSRFYSIIAGPQIFSILTYIIYIILGSLMIEQNSSTKVKEKGEQQYKLKYKESPVEGGCYLLSIIPVYKSKPLYILSMILCVVFCGFPLLLAYWFPKLRKIIYYRPCRVNQATNFYIKNYDKSLSYPSKQFKKFHFSYKESRDVILFVNRSLTYIVEHGTVQAASYKYIERIDQIMNNKRLERFSYNDQQVQNLTQSYGPGVANVYPVPIPILFFKQVLRPIYLFILFSCSFWFYQTYYIYSGIILLSSTISLVTNLIQTYNNNKKICSMIKYQQQVNTIRNGQIQLKYSHQIVPGDIVFFKNQMKIPFDGILLQGEVLVNESALTGQSDFIVKKPEIIKSQQILGANYLREGTNLILVQNKGKFFKFDHYRQKYGVPIIVVRTNFSTFKGQIIRMLQFSSQSINAFDSQSIKFLVFMAFIALIAYIFLVVKLREYLAGKQLFQKFLDLITVTVPPGLPVSIAFSRIVTIQKLRKKNIYCSSPKKITHGGIVNWICLDKTGTITQDQMTPHSLLLIKDSKFFRPIQIGNHVEQAKRDQTQLPRLIENNHSIISTLNNIAINNSLYIQNSEIKGSSMQIDLLNFAEFTLKTSQVQGIQFKFDSKRGHKGQVYIKFQYQYKIQRMSAIGRSSETGDEYYIYVKGLPQGMYPIFEKQTLPYNYFQILNEYVQKGFKVYPLGSRKINQNFRKFSRQQLQRDLIFDGFLIFQNKIRANTQKVIEQLINAELGCIMVTGDSIISAVNTAYKCGISNTEKITVICDVKPSQNQLLFQKFQYKPLTQMQKSKNSKKHFKVDIIDQQHFIEQKRHGQKQNPTILSSSELINQDSQKIQSRFDGLVIMKIKNQNTQLCLTGAALNKLFPNLDRQLTINQAYILSKITTFAKVTPIDKIKIISLYRRLGKTVAMCAKGVNNFGAFKVADIGLSLCMEQYSIAAPFTSQISDLGALQQLLKECRAGVTTNLSLFNTMAMYSLIQFTTTIITQINYSIPPLIQYMYWDVFCNYLLFMTIILTSTATKLSVYLPKSFLFSFSNFISIATGFMYQLAGQILILIGVQRFFANQIGYSQERVIKQFQQNSEQFINEQTQNSSLFLFCNALYIMSFIAYNISKPFRKRFYTNPYFMAVFIIVQTYNLVMILYPGSRLRILQIGDLTYQTFLGYIFGLSIAFGLLMVFTEKFVYNPLFKYLKHKYPQKKWL